MLNVFRLAAMLASALMLLASPVWAQPAPDGNSVLIYSNSGTTAYSTAATGKGFTVVTATDAQWSARSTADFATFRALIIGDDDCPRCGQSWINTQIHKHGTCILCAIDTGAVDVPPDLQGLAGHQFLGHRAAPGP